MKRHPLPKPQSARQTDRQTDERESTLTQGLIGGKGDKEKIAR